MPAVALETGASAGAPPRSRHTPAPPNELLARAESQWLFTEAELLQTPSILDGLAPEKEREYRYKGANFILQVGIMLKLPHLTLATASVFLQRFFMRHSMHDLPSRPGFHYYSMAATSLFLATKVEENCRKMKELVVACVRVAQKDPHKAVDEQDREFWRWKDNIIHNEDLLLEAICFDLSLEPPYKILFEFLVFFGEENNKRLRNAAWAFVSDSCLTMLCLLFPSRTIAASALYAAAKHCDVCFPDDEDGRPWWDSVGVDIKSIRKACNFMAEFYENTPTKGSKDGGIHEHTPEDGDELGAKTREKAINSIIHTGDDASESGASPSSVSGLDRGKVKRKREDDEETQQTVSINGVGETQDNAASQLSINDEPQRTEPEDEQRKKQKINGEGAYTNGDLEHLDGKGNTTTAGVNPIDNVSEEGEVEN